MFHESASVSTRRFVRSLRRNQTVAEQIMWSQLRGRRLHGLRFRRQHPIAGWVVDFYCGEAKLAIELDGAVHDNADARLRDAERTRLLEASGICVVRFSNDDVERDLAQVLEVIAARAQSRGRHPSPSVGMIADSEPDTRLPTDGEGPG
jgi:very-short-patch-repair endonuclease